jgi:hypothetical protein
MGVSGWWVTSKEQLLLMIKYMLFFLGVLGVAMAFPLETVCDGNEDFETEEGYCFCGV